MRKSGCKLHMQKGKIGGNQKFSVRLPYIFGESSDQPMTNNLRGREIRKPLK